MDFKGPKIEKDRRVPGRLRASCSYEYNGKRYSVVAEARGSKAVVDLLAQAQTQAEQNPGQDIYLVGPDEEFKA